jgi:hypothetical protein
METAWNRTFKESLPENMILYDMVLTDASGIPLTKLGTRTLHVVIPLPAEFAGQEVKAVSVDRNGQLQYVTAKRVLLQGTDALLLQTTQPSQTGIYMTGEPAAEEEVEEAEVYLEAQAQAPGKTAAPEIPPAVKILVSVAFGVSGVWLIGSTFTRRKESQDQT